MSPSTQAKLLRVLQDQEFQRLGGTRVLRTDARLVAGDEPGPRPAHARRLLPRGSLLPPERDPHPPAAAARAARTIVVALAHHFLQRVRARARAPAARASADAALARLRAHAWPGNVRELRNAIERAVLLADRRAHRRRRSRCRLDASGRLRGRAGARSSRPAGCACARSSARWCSEALRRTGLRAEGRRQLLGVSRRKLNYMIRRMGITHPSWRRNRPAGSPRTPVRARAARVPQRRTPLDSWGASTNLTALPGQGSSFRLGEPGSVTRCLHAHARRLRVGS